MGARKKDQFFALSALFSVNSVVNLFLDWSFITLDITRHILHTVQEEP